MDKQPHGEGWEEGIHPTKPVIKNNKLYGRGSSDDGYSLFAAICSIKCIQERNGSHPRCVIIIEGDEEGHGVDLPYYFQKKKEQIGDIYLLICLDSDSSDYERLWISTSLRGCMNFELKVSVLPSSIHSGGGGGIYPDSFMIIRNLLDRIEDSNTGKLADFLQVSIPEDKLNHIKNSSKIIGNPAEQFSCLEGVKNCLHNEKDDINIKLLIANSWYPSLAVIGAQGLPSLENGGNLIRTETVLSICIRLPPTLNSKEAFEKIKNIFKKDPPFGAHISIENSSVEDGWNANKIDDWLLNCLFSASQNIFGKDPVFSAGGGAIPIVGSLAKQFPKAQLLVCGVVGPDSNIHASNESLDIPFSKRFTLCLIKVIEEASKTSDSI